MFYIGIDVSKSKLDCSLLVDVVNGKRKSKSVANSKAGIADLLAWCTQKGINAKQAVVVTDLHAIMDDCMDAAGRAMQERLPKALAYIMNRPPWPYLTPV